MDRPDRRPVVAALAGCVLGLLVFAGLYQNERRAATSTMQAAATEMLANASIRAEEHFRAIQRMGHRWEAVGGTPWRAWTADARSLLNDLPALKSIVWSSTDLSQNWIVDRRGESQLLGIDLDRPANERSASATSGPALPRSSGPQPVGSGGQGFHYDVPLLMPDESRGGFIRAVIQYQDLMLPAFWDFAGAYAVSVTINGERVAGGTHREGAPAAVVERRVLGEDWQLEVSPLNTLVRAQQLSEAIGASLLIALLGLIASIALHFRSSAAERARLANATREHLQTAIDALDSPFAYFDGGDRLRHWNQAFGRLHGSLSNAVQEGATYRELLTQTIYRGVIKEAVGQEESFIQHRMALHGSGSFSLERQLSDGRWIRTEEHRSGSGETVTLWTDITEQKQREEQLKEQRDRLAATQRELTSEQQQFRAFVEASADWQWSTDADHRYTWFSENVEKWAQFPREWHYGKSRIELGQPDEPNPDWDAHVRQLENHEPFRDVVFHRIAPDGERWVRSSGLPQFDDEGRFTGYLGTGADITELKLAERQSAVMRDRLSAAVSAISEGLMLFDADDRLVLCNENFLSHTPGMEDYLQEGADYTEVIRLAARTILPDESTNAQRDEWLKRRMNLRDRDEPVMEFRNRAGAWCRVAEYRTADGGTVMIRNDITDLKQRQFELEAERNRAQEANRAKTDFLTNMSHELRTPLNAIIGFSDVMQTGMFGPLDERYSDYAKDIGASGRHLLSLINDLLDGAKIESGQYTLETEDLALPELLHQVSMIVQPMLDSQGLVLQLRDEEADGVIVHADARAMRQMLLNLLSNAIKFSHQGGEVGIDVHADGPDLEIRVSDKGIGMHPKDLERVFERFVQVQDPLRRSHDGTGIGLPLSRSLAELHGGTLHLQQGDRAGVTAVLRLPGVIVGAEAAPSRSIA